MSSRSIAICVACAITWIVSAPIHADGIIRVPLDFPDIASAVAAATDGTVIQVAEGVYDGGFEITVGLTLQGGFPPDFDGPADPWLHPTIVTATAPTNGINVTLGPGTSAAISGLTVDGGEWAIDVELTGNAALGLSESVLDGDGGCLRAVCADTSFLSVTFVTLTGAERIGAGGAALLSAGGQAGINVTDSAIVGNAASEGGAGAAVVLTDDAAIFFIGVHFDRNTHLGQGAAGEGDGVPSTILYDVSNSAALFVTSCLIEGNVGSTPGAGAVGGTSKDESLVQIELNEFRESVEGFGGEAIETSTLGTSALRVLNNRFTGGTQLVGPVINYTAAETSVGFILNNRFEHYESPAPVVRIEQLDSTFVNVDGNVLRDNTTEGPVLELSVAELAFGALLRAINNQISRNTSTAGSGGARFEVQGNNIGQFGHNTIYGNTSASGVAGARVIAGPSSPVQVSNNVFAENRLDSGAVADLETDGFLVRVFGNFFTGDGDPEFIDAAGGNFRLAASSILIDAADPKGFEVDHDWKKLTRPIGDANDIGSDEWGLGGDFDHDEDVDLFDLEAYYGCVTGPGGGPLDEGCAIFDFDYDEDVDFADFGGYQAAFTGGL